MAKRHKPIRDPKGDSPWSAGYRCSKCEAERSVTFTGISYAWVLFKDGRAVAQPYCVEEGKDA